MTLSSLLLLVLSIILITNAQTPSPTSAPTQACSPGAFFNGEFINPDGAYNLKWAINCDAGDFSALITAKGHGWVGFGLNNDFIMIGGYIVQTHVINGTVEHRAGHNVDYNGPVTIPNDIYRGVNATENSTHTTVGWTRDLTLTGTNSSLFSIDPKGNIMLWAYQADTDDFTIEHTDKAAVSINFFTGKTKKPRDYPLIHGSLMLLAFGFLAPAGTFVARYLKAIGHPWYLIHIGIQYTLLALMFSAFVIIENNLGGNRNTHFQNAHQIIGLTIVILTFIQVLFGILSNAMFKPGREGTPFFPDKVHWWLGRLVILYAIANCFIGFDQYGFTHKHNQPYIGFAVWLGLVAILFLIAEIVAGQSHHLDESGENKFQRLKIPIIAYGSMFVLGFILYGITLHEMWNWNH